MAICRYCQQPFSWGQYDDRWVPLVPVGEEAQLERGYVDQDGLLRAGHHLVCVAHGPSAVRITKLATPMQARDVLPTQSATEPLVVPIKRPHTRAPIPPVKRHPDRKNDHRRKPKHPQPDVSDSQR